MIQTFKTKLLKKEFVAPEIMLLEFKLLEPQTIDFKAGQYLMLLCPQPDGTNLRRLYSIVSPPSKKESFALIAELVPGGVASTYFSAMKIDDEVQFQGPAGMFMLHRDNNRVFLATGTGIAPIKSILDDSINGNESAQTEHANLLFWGVQYFKDVYFLEELKKLNAQHPTFEFMICLSREKNLEGIPQEDKKYFTLSRVNGGLEKKLGNDLPKDFDYYICGGRTVVESLKQYLYDKNLSKQQVIFEKF